jgi:hypothetical protein
MEFFIKEIYPWLRTTAQMSPGLPFLVGLFLLGRSKGNQFRLLLLYVTLAVCAESIQQLTIKLGTTNNHWISHVNTVLEFSLLATIYYRSFKQPAIKKGIIAAVGVLLLFSIANATIIGSLEERNSVSKIVANSISIVLAIMYFYKVANDLTIKHLDRDPIFLLSCGVIIYKAGISMSFAMFNQALAHSYDAARMCLAVLMVLNIFFYSYMVFVLRRASV